MCDVPQGSVQFWLLFNVIKSLIPCFTSTLFGVQDLSGKAIDPDSRLTSNISRLIVTLFSESKAAGAADSRR